MCIARLVPDEVTRVAAYLDATTSLPERADLLFVFGNRLPTPAQMAVDLFRRYPTSLIVLTGGSNQHTGENEALSHYTIVRSAGVPEEAIIVESRSRNTLENVTLAVPLLEQTIPLTSVTAVLAICKWMHSRRALMTLKRHLPSGIRYYAATYEPDACPRQEWWTTQASRDYVYGNWDAIPRYLARGHLAEISRVGDGYM